MDSIHDVNECMETSEDSTPSLVANIFRSSSKKNMSRSSCISERKIHNLESRIQKLENSTKSNVKFDGTLFGMFAVGCIFNYLNNR